MPALGARRTRDDFLTTERFFGDDGAVACSSVVSLTASLFCSFGGLPSPSLAIPVEIEDDCCSLTCKSLVSGIIMLFTRRNSADLEQNRLKMPMVMKRATKRVEKAMRSFFARSLNAPDRFEEV